MTKKAAQNADHLNAQILVTLAAIIFFGVIAYGYINLFPNIFVGVFVGLFIAALCCLLAKAAGTTEGGRGKRWPLIAVLFALSGFSVYTSLMLTFEGGQIVSDSVTQSAEKLEQLQSAAEQELASNGAAARVNRINSLKESLAAEIRNPVNCGQGPEATRLIGELRRELPGFTPLSMPALDCSKNEEIIADYDKRIADLIVRDPRNYNNLFVARQQIDSLKSRLEALRTEATTNYSPLRVPGVVQSLESFDTEYRNIRYRISKEVSVKELDAQLPIETVRSLGNAARLPNLIFSRIDHPATWVYLIVALGADLFMVYLFGRAKAAEVPREGSSTLGTLPRRR